MQPPRIVPVRPVRAFACVTGVLGAALTLACGPGQFGSDGEGFGDEIGTSGGGNSSSSSTDGTASVSSSGSDDWTEPDTDDWTEPDTETETETDTSADDWTDPDPDPLPDIPDPVAGDCNRVWTHLDPLPSHGHIGATPIGGRPNGGFISVNPVLESINAVNVDARVRSWGPDGGLVWDQDISWDVHRDDPLAVISDSAGDIFVGGRINANTFEDAMVSKIDGVTGEILWTYLHGAAGGFSEIAHNGAVVVAAGMISSFGLVIIAFEPDTGEILWEAAPGLQAGQIGGLIAGGGTVDALVRRSVDGQPSVDILRFTPLGTTATVLPTLANDPDPTPHGLVRFGPTQLAALVSLGESPWLAILNRASGHPLSLIQLNSFDGFGPAMNLSATELVELPGPKPGLAIGGMAWDGDTGDAMTFVVRLDAGLQVVCMGSLSRGDLGVSQAPQLRGMTVAPNGVLTTGSFTGSNRRSVFARWD